MKHQYLYSVIVLIACIALGAAPAPVFETEFQRNEQGQVLDNINPALPGNVTGSTLRFLPTELSGAVQFTANPEDSIDFPYNAKTDTPEQFTVTGWFKISQLPMKDAPSNKRCCSLACRGWQFYILLHPNGILEGNTHQLFSLTSQNLKKKIIPGRWYHYAYTYSASTKYFQFYINGKLASERDQNWKQDQPFAKPFKRSMYFGSVMKYWPCNGTIGRTRLYNQVLTAEEITASEQDLVRKQLKNIQAGLPQSEKGKTIARHIESLLKKPVIPITELNCIDRLP